MHAGYCKTAETKTTYAKEKNGQIIISHYFVTAKRHIPNTLAQRVPYYGFNIAKRKQK